MNNRTFSSPARAPRRHCLRGALAGLTLAGLALLSRADISLAPLVGTAIGNQASASYNDESGVSRTVLSNIVTTLVQQVYDVRLVQSSTRISNPGGQVFFPHTVTNLGNGIDTFTLAAADGGGATTLTGIAIYIDDDGDGNPDNFTPITTTGPLNSGASFRFIVAATVPPGATITNQGTVSVTASSTGSVSEISSNTDTVTLTNNAVMQVTKAASLGSGIPGASFIYTITYRNIGNSDATQFKITDIIPSALAVGDAKWSVHIGDTLVSDTLPGSVADDAIAYNLTGQTATFVIGKVAPGVSGYVTIAVSVNSGVAPGTISNTAVYRFVTGSDTPTDFFTNAVPFTVLPVVALQFEGPASALPAVPAGGFVSFENVLTNNGTGTDTFNITVDAAGSNFPAGTTFQLFKSDGATPLTDTNGDGVVDSGPVTTGGTYNVVLRANIPGNAATTASTLSVTKTATSTVDPTKTATATDQIAGITGPGVDLLGLAGGTGAGTTTVIDTVTDNPGTIFTFTLDIKNTGPNPDTFNLLAWTDGTYTASTPDFGTVNHLPNGWTVVFRDSTNTVVSNTGIILANATRRFTAAVTVPAGTSPGDVSVWFQSKSPSTGAADFLRDQLTINTVRGITLQTNNVGQTFPGGSVVYEHTLTNTGNITEGETGESNYLSIALVNSLAGAGFTASVYYDADNDGILDADDPIINLTGASPYLSTVKTAGLAKGESVRLLVKLQAPIGATDSTINTTTITVTPASVSVGGASAPSAVSNTDTSSVIRGNLTIVKEQSVNGGSTWTQDKLNAVPGTQIRYRITVTNVGSADALSIEVNDTVPANTVFVTDSQSVTIAGTSTPAAWALSGGNIAVTVGTLQPTETAVIEFAVRINGAAPL